MPGKICCGVGPPLPSALTRLLTSSHKRLAPFLTPSSPASSCSSFPPCQAHACAAIVNFSEGVEADVLPPYLDGLIQKLLTLLQHGARLVQEGALTALASVADSSQVRGDGWVALQCCNGMGGGLAGGRARRSLQGLRASASAFSVSNGADERYSPAISAALGPC